MGFFIGLFLHSLKKLITMEISFFLPLPSCEIEVNGNFPAVPRIGETVSIDTLLKGKELEAYREYVEEFPFVIDVHHILMPKQSSVHVVLSLTKDDKS